MNRRKFLQSTGAVVAASSATRTTALLGEAAAKTVPSGRVVLPINRGWRYSPKSTVAAHAVKFDDSRFDLVTVPHTNVALPWHGFDEKNYTFVSVYRRPIHVPAEAAGKRVFVDFEGVMTASTVYLNGKRLGEYRGGYTPFSFELTKHLNAGTNLLSVDVDSTERPDIPPFGNEIDYLTFGGIYREVSLRIVPNTFIENLHVRTLDVLGGSPSVEVDCYLDRAPGTPTGKLTLRASLRKAGESARSGLRDQAA